MPDALRHHGLLPRKPSTAAASTSHHYGPSPPRPRLPRPQEARPRPPVVDQGRRRRQLLDRRTRQVHHHAPLRPPSPRPPLPPPALRLPLHRPRPRAGHRRQPRADPLHHLRRRGPASQLPRQLRAAVRGGSVEPPARLGGREDPGGAEFRALEVALDAACSLLDTQASDAYPLLDELASKISTLNLGKSSTVEIQIGCSNSKRTKEKKKI